MNTFLGGVTVYEGYVRIDDSASDGELIAFELAAGRYRLPDPVSAYSRPIIGYRHGYQRCTRHYDRS